MPYRLAFSPTTGWQYRHRRLELGAVNDSEQRLVFVHISLGCVRRQFTHDPALTMHRLSR